MSGWRAGCRRGPATDAASAAAAAAAGCLSCLPEYPHSPPQLADSLFCVIGHLSPPGHMTPDYSFFYRRITKTTPHDTPGTLVF